MRIARQLRWTFALLWVAAPASPAQIVGSNVDSIPNDSWVRIYFDHFDQGAKAAGLAPLRESALPAGEREVRLWTQVEIGVPKQLYRFTERGGRVRGEVVEYWSLERGDFADERPGETMHDLMLYTLRGRCDHFTTSADAAACRARFRREPSWAAVLRAAESHGLWSLPDPSVLPKENTIGIDGWTMVVELRDGPRYRTYRYHNPGSHPQWASDAQASGIVGVLRGLDSLVSPPDIHRVYRGLTTGRYRSAFRSCGGEQTWDFYSDLRSMLARAQPELRATAPAQLSDSAARGETLYEVEVLGELTPEWLARRWESKYSHVLQVLELRAVRAAPDSRCSIR